MVIRSDKKRILVVVSSEVYDKLSERAKKENRSLSNMAGTLLAEQLERK